MKIIYYLIIRSYIVWSRIYRFFERKSKNYNKYKLMLELLFIKFNIFKSWNKIKKMIHYETDKPYQLWDVTSDPYCALKRGWGDCDDYSAVAYTVFQDRCLINNKVYNYVGTFYLIYKLGGHVISIWKSKNDYFYISTKKKSTKIDLKYIFNSFDEEKKIKAIAWVKANNKKGFFDIKFNKLYMRSDLEKMYRDIENG